MVLKKIAALCKSAGQIQILEDERRECQWVGTRAANYPLDGYPEVDESTVFALLDIPEKEREKYQVYRNAIANPELYADSGVAEHLIETPRLKLTYGGQELIPAMDTQGGINFYDADYLGPLKDQRNSLDLYIRRDGAGNPVFAVKAGLMLQGMFLPEQVERDKLFEALAEVGKRLSPSLLVDPETGEYLGDEA